MLPTEKVQFVEMLRRAFRFAGKELTAEMAIDWHEEFADWPLAALDSAFRRHRRESPYPPKPADLWRVLDQAGADDGRPGPDEAWGLLVRLVRDERETGVLSGEMREAWSVCGPILDAGDEVGARRCFIEVYTRAVASARQRREVARWTVTLGTDRALRAIRLDEAVRYRRIGRDHAAGLLSGPSPASIDQVAGLLSGPESPPQSLDVAERLRGLAALLRRFIADDDARRRADVEATRAAEDAEKARIAEMIERHHAGERAA